MRAVSTVGALFALTTPVLAQQGAGAPPAGTAPAAEAAPAAVAAPAQQATPAAEAAPEQAPATAAPASGAAAAATPAQPAAPEASLEQRLQALEAEVSSLRAERDEARAEAEAAELAALMEQQGDDAVAAETAVAPFRIYGFADVGLQRAWGGLFDLGLGVTDETTFVLGNVNLFLDFQPEQDWRFLTEVRLTLFPTGAPQLNQSSGELTQVDTTVLDPSSPNSGFTTATWSGIVLERAQVEWTPRDDFNVRAGRFLTPYGIWNVDHGSPVRIMLWPPLMMTAGLMQERQTGVELFGRFHVLPWHLGYNLYVSNGNSTSQADFDDDKAIGGRVYLGRDVPDMVQVGASFFHGNEEAVSQDIGVRPDGTLGLIRSVSWRVHSTVAGVDFGIDSGGFRFRTEALVRWRVFDEGLRRDSFGAPEADTISAGAYALVAYRFRDPGIEPFASFELLRIPLRILEAVVSPTVGVNLHFTPSTSLRFQYAMLQAIDLEDTPNSDSEDLYLHSVASRLVVAF